MKKRIQKNIKHAQKLAFKIIRITSGTLLILLGIAGLILPIVPGIILIFVGIIILNNRRLKNLVSKIIFKIKNLQPQKHRQT